jgi:hypothetical protein
MSGNFRLRCRAFVPVFFARFLAEEPQAPCWLAGASAYRPGAKVAIDGLFLPRLPGFGVGVTSYSESSPPHPPLEGVPTVSTRGLGLIAGIQGCIVDVVLTPALISHVRRTFL